MPAAKCLAQERAGNLSDFAIRADSFTEGDAKDALEDALSVYTQLAAVWDATRTREHLRKLEL